MLPEAIFVRELRNLLSGAVGRVVSEMDRHAPDMRGAVCPWMEALAGSRRAEVYFQDGRAAIFLLPWFLEKNIRPVPDAEFQASLVYSSVNAYYFVRLIDNLLDRQDGPERQLLPAAAFFHAQFQSPYQRYFPPDNPFWNFFHATWTSMAEATFKDAATAEFTESEFAAVAARKSAGVKIPLAAVCFRYERGDLLPRWCAFYDRLACWNQMLNDLLDWQKDMNRGLSTFFLSEAKRSKRAGESVTAWMVRSGFAWACELLQSWMRELQGLAPALRSGDLEAYLKHREREIANWQGSLTPDLARLARLASLLEGTPATEPRSRIPPGKVGTDQRKREQVKRSAGGGRGSRAIPRS